MKAAMLKFGRKLKYHIHNVSAIVELCDDKAAFTQRIQECLLGQLNYVGIGCLNIKIIDGLPKVLEINPRLGASMTPFCPE